MEKREAFSSQSSFGTTMLISVIDEYGTEAMQWDPVALRKQIDEDFSIEMSSSAFDRLMGAINLLSSDLFFVSLEAFNNICEALNFGPVDGLKFVPCELEDIMWSCTEARLLLGAEEYDNADWSHDVRRYTALQLTLEGITTSPDILGFAEYNPDELDNKDMLLAQDPLMAGTYQNRQNEELQQLNDAVINNLQVLLKQVASLKLNEGRTVEVNKMLDDIKNKIKGDGDERINDTSIP